MKHLVSLTILSCFLLIANAQPGSPRISMGETPGINLSNSELKGPIKEIVELKYYKQPKEDKIDTSKVMVKTIMKFDQKGNETEELEYGRTGKLLSRCIYDYNNPKLVVIKKFIQDTLLLGKYIYAFNDSGRVVKLDILAGKYAVGFKTLFTYNNKGIKVSETSGAASKDTMFVIDKTIFQYNDNGQKISRKRYDLRGNLIDNASFSYDGLGDVTENGNLDVALIQVNSIVKRTKMDEHGNWRLTTVEDDGFSDVIQLKRIMKRVILYY